jgi:hypothetical protein
MGTEPSPRPVFSPQRIPSPLFTGVPGRVIFGGWTSTLRGFFKVRHTGAQERWVFVPVTLAGAPWLVESYLTGEFECLPATDPNLPSPVTGIWLASTPGTHGVRRESTGWRLFRIGEESR